MESTTSTVIVTTITDVLLRMNLSISNCRGQCYDGASSMSGSRSGVAIQLSKLEPQSLIHGFLWTLTEFGHPRYPERIKDHERYS